MTHAGRMLLGLLALSMTGCGTVGSPVPPEAIGVKARQERDKKAAESAMKLKEETGAPEAISNRPTGDNMTRSR